MNGLKSIRLALWGAVALLCVAVAVAFYLRSAGPAATTALSGIGGPFTLTDQHGTRVTEADLKGHPSAVFFGYTFCPDVCPTTLYDLTVWMEKLGPDADKLKVYFVTVDPERDTEAKMAAYLSAFDKRIVGLTGTRAEVDAMLAAYRVYSRKVPQDDGSYTMDHTASVYLLDGSGGFVGALDYHEDEAVALDKLKRLVAAS
jgi:protein SCO1/2